MPFLVGAGHLSDAEMTAGSIALKGFCGGNLIECSCSDSPNKFLKTFAKENALFQLKGDPAHFKYEEGSWLECLGAWKIPVILMVTPSTQGQISGAAPAYVALCKEFVVPLIGVVQLGGDWDSEKRALDGLPWCGRLPKEQIEDSNYLVDSLLVVENLKRRMKTMNF